jgi:hypothetical protein
MTQSINIRLCASQRQELARLAAATNWSTADLIRSGIDLLLAEQHRIAPRQPLQERAR